MITRSHKRILLVATFVSVVVAGLGVFVVLGGHTSSKYSFTTPPVTKTLPRGQDTGSTPPIVATPKDEPTPSSTLPRFATTSPTASTQPSTLDPLPSSVSLLVPFTPQAPTANWDTLHNEACEEASVIMASRYFAGDRSEKLAAPFVETEITKISKYFDDTLGYHLDTTSAETAAMAEKLYGLRTELLANFTEDQIKAALAANKLVLLSTDGRLLANPNYKQPGPVHHMLVLTGYDGDTFITNDSGTRRGAGYRYPYGVLEKAAGDWVHASSKTDTSIKVAILVSK